MGAGETGEKGQPEEQPIWTQVTLPHCFNAEDAVDPNVNYYQVLVGIGLV